MKYFVQIEGITPFLMEKYVGESGTTKAGKDYSKEWIKGVYLDKDNQVVMTSEMFKACLQNGSRGLHEGKTFYSKYLPVGLILEEFESPVLVSGNKITIEDIEKNSWINYFRRVVGPGRSVQSSRAEIPTGWVVNWNLIIRDDVLTENRLREIIERAGTYAGVGGQRPSSPKKPGNYGQFKINKFKLMS